MKIHLPLRRCRRRRRRRLPLWIVVKSHHRTSKRDVPSNSVTTQLFAVVRALPPSLAVPFALRAVLLPFRSVLFSVLLATRVLVHYS